ncbi:sialate O-acetylesterase [Chitinophaga sp. sic0106]|uniref:sialate O-acetylesterase n=1 Tax=Chitinophaga sp. sic0106 TaxID=2854785 RepID=UPI001C46F561|nr:sialate O-acetylesterase [Chitinophaga sp. sic0106]MBV7530948.1 sialate O-acetylesterase [Chitinophaga sp. sic0106]
MKKVALLLPAMLLIFIATYANIRLPNVLSSNMVLQQKSTVKLWGWADPTEKIIISTSWNNRSDTVYGTRDATFMATIPTPAAGGPYTITFKGNNTVTLENVMLGEVWVCSGQSNMEWSSYQQLQQIVEEIPRSQQNNIRLFNIPRSTAANPQENVTGTWQICGPASLPGFSAVGYFFGKRLQSELNVPIGLINASWGGTPAEVWTPSVVVENNPELSTAAEKIQPALWWPYKPGKTYNAMIAPLTKYSVSGVIWYQGESNVLTSNTYSQLFTNMISAWRTAWSKDFPFYYVQIAPYDYEYANTGALLREQQVKSLSLHNTGMVVITDLVDDVKNIHPKNKRDVANRLANMALGDTYQQMMPVAFRSPLYKSMEINGNKIILSFENAPNGFMTTNGNAPTEFYIAGADKNFVAASTKMEKGKIIVSSGSVAAPVAVRFGFSNTAMPNLFSKEGLPVSPFRTDDWKVDTSKIR